MPEVAPRYPCPVCLGVQMEKARVGSAGELVLDHCRRCGGMWFERGEAQQVKGRPPRELWKQVSRRKRRFRSPCHECHASMDRNAQKCPACGWENRIACPVCQQPMQSRAIEGVKLDACGSCKGVWFDHPELTALWTLSLTAELAKRGGVGVNPALDASDVLVETLFRAPDLVYYGARAAGHLASSSAEALMQAPEAASGLFSAVGDAAAAVFEVILEILGGLGT